MGIHRCCLTINQSRFLDVSPTNKSVNKNKSRIKTKTDNRLVYNPHKTTSCNSSYYLFTFESLSRENEK